MQLNLCTCSISRPNFSQPSCRIEVDLLSYKSKTTDKKEQYNWRAEKFGRVVPLTILTIVKQVTKKQERKKLWHFLPPPYFSKTSCIIQPLFKPNLSSASSFPLHSDRRLEATCSSVQIFFLHPVLLEPICYWSRANRQINESHTTGWLKKIWTGWELHSNARPIFFLRSRRIRVNLLTYERKMTDKWEQYDWRAEKNLDG